MPTEIERKFLVNGDQYKQDSIRSERITQAYICTDPEHTVRIRRKGTRGFITIKGQSSKSGLSRFEWEKEISAEEAIKLIELCSGGIIDKTRWIVECGALCFEVDEFHGDNEGLVVAELELKSENQTYTSPEWLGKEVSGIQKYYNSALASQPFRSWQKD